VFGRPPLELEPVLEPAGEPVLGSPPGSLLVPDPDPVFDAPTANGVVVVDWSAALVAAVVAVEPDPVVVDVVDPLDPAVVVVAPAVVVVVAVPA
jgi:hypothetical protein